MEQDNKKKKVLVVDDDDALNTVLVDKLVFAGFEVQGASNGEEGLKKALEFHPDIILLDVMMPKMNGMEMLKKLREDAWGKTAKVVMLTLLEQMDYMAEATENNVLGYFVKTNHSLNEIVQKIETLIGKLKTP